MNLTELQSLIDRADNAYYTKGTSIMEDARYDKLKEELRAVNPSDPRLISVGSKVRDNILQKKSHTIPMGSQDKAMNKDEFVAWINANKLQNTTLHASHKMDGGSFSLEYRAGRLVAAVSRGDGLVGEDITANAYKFKNVPPFVMSADGTVFSGFIRGEVVLTTEDWLEVDPQQTSNPRNLAVGIARRKDGVQSEYLKFFGFRVFDADGELRGDFEHELSQYLENLGFDTAPYMTGKWEDVWTWFEKTASERQKLNYWIDGVVVKVNDLVVQIGMGESSNCPKGQIAVKFEAEGGVTTLNSVDYQVGCTGAIAPVANFDTVRIGGTNVSCATLCNWEYINTLDVCVGDQIRVIKAGDIIPRIMEVVTKGTVRTPIPEPTECPVCKSKVGRKSNVGGDDSTVIYCVNDECPAVVVGRISRFVKSIDIQGIGDNLIESLVAQMNVKDASDLYKLHLSQDVLANVTLSGGGRFGEKRTERLLEEINKKRELTLSDFLGSLGVFGLGKRRVALIQAAVPGLLDTLDDWFTDVLVKNAARAGVPNTAARINAELIELKPSILNYLANGVVIKKPEPKKVARAGANVICITGALTRPKSFFQQLIEQRGDVYTDTFSKAVTHLVAADPNSGSAKLKKATKQGTKVISEDELIALLQGK